MNCNRIFPHYAQSIQIFYYSALSIFRQKERFLLYVVIFPRNIQNGRVACRQTCYKSVQPKVIEGKDRLPE